MSEREDLIDQIATLEAERIGLRTMETSLHERFMASPPGSDEERAIGRQLDSLCDRYDAIGDALVRWSADSGRSRLPSLAASTLRMRLMVGRSNAKIHHGAI